MAAETTTQDRSDSIWTREAPGRRRPRFTREQIAQTAIAIADREGFTAVSMRRVAAELETAAMTLYHYVKTKEELISVMADQIMGEFLLPDSELPIDPSEALRAIAHQTRQALLNHPWAIEEIRTAELGPNGLRHVEQSLNAVASTGLTPDEQLEVITLLDDYTLGFVLRETIGHTARADPEQKERWIKNAKHFIASQLKSGYFPNLERVFPGNAETAWDTLGNTYLNDERFARGLNTLISGLTQRPVTDSSSQSLSIYPGRHGRSAKPARQKRHRSRASK